MLRRSLDLLLRKLTSDDEFIGHDSQGSTIVFLCESSELFLMVLQNVSCQRYLHEGKFGKASLRIDSIKTLGKPFIYHLQMFIVAVHAAAQHIPQDELIIIGHRRQKHLMIHHADAFVNLRIPSSLQCSGVFIKKGQPFLVGHVMSLEKIIQQRLSVCRYLIRGRRRKIVPEFPVAGRLDIHIGTASSEIIPRASFLQGPVLYILKDISHLLDLILFRSLLILQPQRCD